MRRDPNADISEDRIKASQYDSDATLEEKKRLANLKEEAMRKEAGKTYDAQRKSGKPESGAEVKKADKSKGIMDDGEKSGVSKKSFTDDPYSSKSGGKSGGELEDSMTQPRTIDDDFRSLRIGAAAATARFLIPFSSKIDEVSFSMQTGSAKAEDGELRGGRTLNVFESLFGPRQPAPGLRFAPSAPGFAGPGGMGGGGYSGARGGYARVDTRDIEEEKRRREGVELQGQENRADVEAQMRYARSMMGIKPGLSLKHDLSQGPKGPTHVMMTDGGTA